MNGFIAAELPGKQTDPIENGDFWPEIDMTALSKAMRLDGTTTPERQRDAACAAVININRELKPWRVAQQILGFPTLHDVPYDDAVDGKSPLIHNYHRAVYCITKANLTERYRDFDATAKGDRRAAQLESEVGDLWRDARWAMREIQGLNHNTVGLV